MGTPFVILWLFFVTVIQALNITTASPSKTCCNGTGTVTETVFTTIHPIPVLHTTITVSPLPLSSVVAPVPKYPNSTTCTEAHNLTVTVNKTSVVPKTFTTTATATVIQNVSLMVHSSDLFTTFTSTHTFFTTVTTGHNETTGNGPSSTKATVPISTGADNVTSTTTVIVTRITTSTLALTNLTNTEVETVSPVSIPTVTSVDTTTLVTVTHTVNLSFSPLPTVTAHPLPLKTVHPKNITVSTFTFHNTTIVAHPTGTLGLLSLSSTDSNEASTTTTTITIVDNGTDTTTTPSDTNIVVAPTGISVGFGAGTGTAFFPLMTNGTFTASTLTPTVPFGILPPSTTAATASLVTNMSGHTISPESQQNLPVNGAVGRIRAPVFFKCAVRMLTLFRSAHANVAITESHSTFPSSSSTSVVVLQNKTRTTTTTTRCTETSTTSVVGVTGHGKNHNSTTVTSTRTALVTVPVTKINATLPRPHSRHTTPVSAHTGGHNKTTSSPTGIWRNVTAHTHTSSSDSTHATTMTSSTRTSVVVIPTPHESVFESIVTSASRTFGVLFVNASSRAQAQNDNKSQVASPTGVAGASQVHPPIKGLVLVTCTGLVSLAIGAWVLL